MTNVDIVRTVAVALGLVTLACSGTPAGPCADDPACACQDGGCPPDTGRPRSERCDGLDDDGDGRIDEGCPCSPGEMQACWPGSALPQGACRLGTMVCAALPGMEFAQWGDSSCDGATLPAEERCDGTDADCDGAVDEGCECRDGEARVCEGSDVGVCRAARQHCVDGAWSACSEAVGPFEEICGDEVDGDCDGSVDEGCGCGPIEECGPIGLDAPSFLDERPADEYRRLRHAFVRGRIASLIVRLFGSHPYDLEYALLVSDADGTEHARSEPFVLARPSDAGYDERPVDLLWTGSELWVLVQQIVDEDRVRRRIAVRRFDADARPLGEPVVLAGGVDGTASDPVARLVGDRVYFGWTECDDADLYDATEHRYAYDNREGGCTMQRIVVQARDHALAPIGDRVELRQTQRLWGVDMGRLAFTEGTLALSWVEVEVTPLAAGASWEMRTWLALVRDGEVVARRDHPIPRDAGGGGAYRLGHGSTTVSAGAGVFLACESVRFDAITCQRYDADGTALGARFGASSFDTKYALDTVWSGCDFVLAAVGRMAEPPATFQRWTQRIERLDPRTGARSLVTTLETDYNVEQHDDDGAFREVLDINNAFVVRRQWLEGAPLPTLATPMTRVYSSPHRVLRRDIYGTFSCR